MAKTIPTPLSTLFPSPALVVLGGREFLAGQLRLRDLAALEAWAVSGIPDPLDGLPSPEDDPERSTRFDRLRELWGRSMPVAYGSEEVAQRLATPSGAAAYLLVVLGSHNPDFEAADAVDLAGRLTAEEWAAVDRLAWGVQPWESIKAELEGPADAPPRPLDWGEVVDGISREYGLSYSDVGNLTVGQFGVMRRGGRPVPARLGPEFWSPEAADEWTARRKAIISGEIVPDVVPATPAERAAQLKQLTIAAMWKRIHSGQPVVSGMLHWIPEYDPHLTADQKAVRADDLLGRIASGESVDPDVARWLGVDLGADGNSQSQEGGSDDADG